MDKRETNRLIHETSPYLLQHARNPVDWYPWCDEALARAQREHKPILLSIGYSACHWCHVMERESFRHEGIASQMNAHFINVKVDREERPDLDDLYMTAVQAFTGGHGGWPMTVFLTPQGEPFLGGTYFPPEPQPGSISLPQMMDKALEIFSNREETSRITAAVLQRVGDAGRFPAPALELGQDWLDRVASAALDNFDAHNGGFSESPKFPPHTLLRALLAHWHTTRSPRSLRMVTTTLDHMALGGLYDLVGGGFARYSVDEEWRIPHFEKMLFDNAQLAELYVTAWCATGGTTGTHPHYARIANETLNWAQRELMNRQGAFMASQDADSEGEEGRYFVWSRYDLEEALGAEDAARAAALFDVTDEGTFEAGESVLRLSSSVESHSPDEQQFIARVLRELKDTRRDRVPPGRDDKCVTAWNALMISAFARAGSAFDDPERLEQATRIAAFILGNLVKGGRLHRTWKDGEVRGLGLACDHAYLLNALIDLYEATLDLRWLKEANRWADTTVNLFWDDEDGGLFYTGHDAPPLVARSKKMLGGAEPSPNGVAALAMARLAALCHRDDLGARTDTILKAYDSVVQRLPRVTGIEAIAATRRTTKSRQLAIVGPDDNHAAELIAVCRQRYLPFLSVARAKDDEAPQWMPWVQVNSETEGATAFLCQGERCLAPTDSPEQLRRLLDDLESPSRERKNTRKAPPFPEDRGQWLNGRPLSPAALAGQIKVVHFWRSNSVLCHENVGAIQDCEARFRTRPVAFVGVHTHRFPVEGHHRSVSHMIDRLGIRHRVVLDPDQALSKAYGLETWPTVAIIDATGHLAWMHSGPVPSETLIEEIADVLDECRDRGELAMRRIATGALPTDTGSILRFPARVAVFPNEARQAYGDDPFSRQSRLYISDTGNHRVIETDLLLGKDYWPRLRVLRTFGSGFPGHKDGSATTAQFHRPQGLDRDETTLYIADTGNHRLRSVDLASGTVDTLAGTGKPGRSRTGTSKPLRLSLASPTDVTTVADHRSPRFPHAEAVLVAMAGANQIWVYLCPEEIVDSSSIDDTIPGDAPRKKRGPRMGPMIGSGANDHVDGRVKEAALSQPTGMVINGTSLVIVDSETSSIRLVDLSEHEVSTVLGRGPFDFGDKDGANSRALMQGPRDVTITSGKAFVVDTYNNKVKRVLIDRAATKTIVGGSSAILNQPEGIAMAGRFLIIADTGNHRIRVACRHSGEIRDLEIEGL